MKIGIITFHFPTNYGAMVQAYAMQEHLRLMGHDAYIIDYAPEYHLSIYTAKITWKWCITGGSRRYIPKRFLLKLFDGLRRKRNKNFQDFSKKYFRLYAYRPDDDMSFFDCILLGSDQIWNQSITNGCFDGPYYGEGFKCRVFSYAASNRAVTLTESEKSQYRAKLANLSAIGVRESHLQQLLQPLTEKRIYLNVDPTLLARPSVYDRIDLSRPIKEKYIVIYELINHDKVQKMAHLYAKKIGAKLIILVNNTFVLYGKKYDQLANPERFLAYIKNAECVFTTSFHGTALSLAFHKDFYAIRQLTSADMRLESILSQIGLINHFIEMDDTPSIEHINYTVIEDRLNTLRVSSQEFLEGAISGIL